MVKKKLENGALVVIALGFSGLAYWFKVDTELAALMMWAFMVVFAAISIIALIIYNLPQNGRDKLIAKIKNQSHPE